MKLRTSLFVIGSMLGLVSLSLTARADTITTLFTTGAGIAEGSVDPHWKLGNNPGDYGSTLTVAESGTLPLDGHWIENTSTSKWLIPQGHQMDAADSATNLYWYSTAFSLASYDPNTASIHLSIAVDDFLKDILLNGVSLASAPYNYDFSAVSFHGRNDFDINQGFVSGDNTLVFEVENEPSTDLNPTGINVIFSGTAVVIPEASTSTLAALGMLAIAAASFVRSKQRLAG